MELLVLLTMTAKADQRDEFVAAMRATLDETRNKDGCERIDLFERLDQPGSFVVIEEWSSEASQEAYVQWRRANPSGSSFLEYLEGRPLVQRLRISGVT